MVAAIIEGERDVVSERTRTTPLVDRDGATRRARRLAVQSDVGSLQVRAIYILFRFTPGLMAEVGKSGQHFRALPYDSGAARRAAVADG